jgi:hypothetical protein
VVSSAGRFSGRFCVWFQNQVAGSYAEARALHEEQQYERKEKTIEALLKLF